MVISLAVAAIVLALAVLLLFRGNGLAIPASEGGGGRKRAGPSGASRAGAAGTGYAGNVRPRSCPLCGELLEGGERVQSDLAKGVGDRMMRIHGCPRCWPAAEGSRARTCPVCGRELGPGDLVYARYFERPGRHHVHVLGCDGCRGKRRN